MEVILGVAARGGPQGAVALNYFLDNYARRYMDYTGSNCSNIAFVPAIHGGEKKLVTPLEVFSNTDWQLFGFPVLDPAMARRQDAVIRLRIKENPPIIHLLRILETSPPNVEAQAREWFGVLSRYIPGLCNLWLDKFVC